MDKPIYETLHVSFDISDGKDESIALVGHRKPDDSLEILNVFIGKEAEELYVKLLTKPEKKSED